jgi:signal peptidase I
MMPRSRIRSASSSTSSSTGWSRFLAAILWSSAIRAIPPKSYIKRVIGMAGDRIRIDGGQVYVNGQALDEDYVPPAYTDTRSYPEWWCRHQFFVLGDHRSMSNDSRDFGPVNQSYIYGKAVFGYWPMDKLGRVR